METYAQGFFEVRKVFVTLNTEVALEASVAPKSGSAVFLKALSCKTARKAFSMKGCDFRPPTSAANSASSENVH